MISGKELMLLSSFSFENKDGNLELDTRYAPQDIVDLAKELHWRPYDKVEGGGIIY